MIYLIGCGGVGGWVVDMLNKLRSKQTIVFVDGDDFELKNRGRQQHCRIGQNKAQVLTANYRGPGSFMPRYLTLENVENPPFLLEMSKGSRNVVLCCVDSNSGREASLALARKQGALLIVAANETESASATVYPTWVPTIFKLEEVYPEWFTESTRDAFSISCTQAAEEKPQTILANMTAAIFAINLLTKWEPYLAKDINLDSVSSHPLAELHFTGYKESCEVKRPWICIPAEHSLNYEYTTKYIVE